MSTDPSRRPTSIFRYCTLFVALVAAVGIAGPADGQSFSDARRDFRRAFSGNNAGEQKKAVRKLAATEKEDAFRMIGNKLAGIAERLYEIKKIHVTAHRKKKHKVNLSLDKKEEQVLSLKTSGRIKSLRGVFKAGAGALRDHAPAEWLTSFVRKHGLQKRRLQSLFLIMKGKLVTALAPPGSRDAVKSLLRIHARVEKRSDRIRSEKKKLDRKIYSLPHTTKFKQNKEAAGLTTRRLRYVMKASILDAHRKQIYTTLAEVTSDGGVEALINTGLTARTPGVRAVAAYGLGARGDADSRTALVKRLKKEPSPDVKIELLKAIGRRGVQGAVDVVKNQLKGTRMPVQYATAHVLSRIGTMDTVPVLIDRLEKVKNGRIAAELVDSLEYMTGQSHGHQVMNWRRWWQKNKDSSLKPPGQRRANLRKVQKKKEQNDDPDRDRPGTRAIFYDTPIESNRVLFVVDASLSMDNPTNSESESIPAGLRKKPGPKIPDLSDDPTKMEMAKRELMKAIKGLREGQMFNIVFFAGYETVWNPRRLLPATPELKSKAFQFIQPAKMEWATDIFGALELGYLIGESGTQPVDKQYIRTGARGVGPDSMYLVTDGKPAFGQYDPSRNLPVYNTFIEKLNRLNQFRLMKIHGIHIGESGSTFLKKIVERTLYYPNGNDRPDWWIRPGTFKAKN